MFWIAPFLGAVLSAALWSVGSKYGEAEGGKTHTEQEVASHMQAKATKTPEKRATRKPRMSSAKKSTRSSSRKKKLL